MQRSRSRAVPAASGQRAVRRGEHPARALNSTLEVKLTDRAPGVLYADAETSLLLALAQATGEQAGRVFLGAGVEQALEILAREPIALVVSSQAELLAELRHRHPQVLRVLITSEREVERVARAVNQVEVFRLIASPWQPETLLTVLGQAREHFETRRELARLGELSERKNRELRSLARTLEARVAERTEALQRKHAEVRRAYVSTIKALAEAVDAKDPYTRGHSERVGVYASRLAIELGLSHARIERIYLAGLLHDIGKIGVPDAVLSKPGRLTEREFSLMREHPAIGARILEPVEFLQDVVPCVRHHHEWYDGSARGYPDRLRGRDIPFESRIILVADTVEAMSSDRPYRGRLGFEEVMEEVSRFRGTQFDPAAADAFLALAEREGESFLEHASKFDLDRFLGEVASVA